MHSPFCGVGVRDSDLDNVVLLELAAIPHDSVVTERIKSTRCTIGKGDTQQLRHRGGRMGQCCDDRFVRVWAILNQVEDRGEHPFFSSFKALVS